MEVRVVQLLLVSPLSEAETRPSIPLEPQPALVHEVDDPVPGPAQGSRPAGGPAKHSFHPSSELKP